MGEGGNDYVLEWSRKVQEGVTVQMTKSYHFHVNTSKGFSVYLE